MPARQFTRVHPSACAYLIAVATLSRDIAAMTTGANSDTCYLAGLLHDVGKPVLAAMMLEAEKMLAKDKPGWVDAELWSTTIEKAHRRDTAEESRATILPFFWDVVAKRGQVFGDRGVKNVARVTNPIRMSYPGYSEMLCGHVDPRIRNS